MVKWKWRYSRIPGKYNKWKNGKWSSNQVNDTLKKMANGTQKHGSERNIKSKNSIPQSEIQFTVYREAIPTKIRTTRLDITCTCYIDYRILGELDSAQLIIFCGSQEEHSFQPTCRHHDWTIDTIVFRWQRKNINISTKPKYNPMNSGNNHKS